METARRRSSLRVKTLSLVAATTVALAAVLYLPLRALLLESFLRLERELALSDLERATNAIDDDVAQLASTCRDYAVWDDTYAFLGGEAPDYAALNFVDETFAHNRLELVALVDAEGSVQFAKGYDLERERARRDVSMAWLSRVCPSSPCDERSGPIDTADGPLLVAMHPVLTSSGDGPTRGTLIMGRMLDRAEVARLASAIDLDLSVSRARSGSSEPRVVPLGDARIAASTVVPDAIGAPYLRVRVEMPRDVYARGLLGMRSVLLAVGVAGLVLGLAILLLIDRVVLRRLGRLSDDVARVSASADPSLRVGAGGDDELTDLAVRINGMLGELASARELIRDALGRYDSEDVARAVLSRPEGAELGGEIREVTILFSDIRRYSTIVEHLAPATVVELLNEHFGAMGEVIESEGGCVIELLGDAILAVFGAPADLPDHAERAVRCAIAMQRRSAELDAAWIASGKARLWQERGIERLSARIGLHSGRVVAGNLGSKTRMKYAVIGDVVNTAARVETLNDELGTDVLLTAEVFAELGPALRARTDDRGEHGVKGRDRAVHVYTVGEAPRA